MGIFEIDMKKVIALSTLSQLGVIIIILGIIEPLLSFFHLLRHAYFKAMLFMCAGIVISNIIPITFSVITVANLRLCGLPFLRGFYSKDIILEVITLSTDRLIIFAIIIVATFFTVTYSCRMSFLLIITHSGKDSIYISDDNDYLIITGILILFPFSIIGGMNIIWLTFSFPPTIFLPL